MQLSPLLKHCTFSYKRVFIPSFIMLYAENIGLRDCSRFLQIGSHMYILPLFLSRQYIYCPGCREI